MKAYMRALRSLVWLLALFVCATAVHAQESVTIRFAVDPGRFDVYSAMLADFEAKNPGIRVELEPTLSEEEFMVQIAGGTAPDVRSVAAAGHALLMENNMLTDLQPYVDRDWTAADIDDI